MLSDMLRLELARIACLPLEPLTVDLTTTWRAAWCLVIVGFVSGAALGLGFRRNDFLGGYDSWSRRLTRLGHIACVALGLLQMSYALSPAAAAEGPAANACRLAWLLGAIAMPVTCWLAAWRKPLRHLFAIPVAALLIAATLTVRAIH